MKMFQLCLAASALLLTCVLSQAAESRVYEIRTYYANPDKLEDLHKRFRDHTLRLFKKHKIESVGYWVPEDNKENKLIFLLAYPSREARETAWKAFSDDPDWKSAYEKSHANGPLVSKAVVEFFTPTDYSAKPTPEQATPPRQFELRTYTTTPGNLKDLHARFRDHTVKLFEKHGMKNIVYLQPMPDQPGAENKLVYFLAHKNDEARKKSFGDFRTDPNWTSALKASEEKAGGSLTAREKGVVSELLKATDYSPLK